jgi:drug/metabolite transporter (DMT)-like permease
LTAGRPIAVAPAAPHDDVRLGLAYAFLANLAFALVSVLGKWLTEFYPLVEIAFFRAAFGLLPCLYFVWMAGGAPSLRTSRPVAQFFRAAVWLLSFLTSFEALRLLPVADATTYFFASPLFIAALSAPILGERVGPQRLTAILVGFIGVLVIASPTGDIFQFGAVFGVGSALCYAAGTLLVRHMSRTETSASIVFYTHVLGTVICGIALPFFWVALPWQHWLAMAALGLGGGISHFWTAQAVRYAPVAAIAPITYTQLVWAVLFGFLVWHDVPTLHLLIGAAIVTIAGIYVARHERRAGS